jgi:Protein of unknown function (DUF4127)
MQAPTALEANLMQIALLPLDERPVNTRLAADVAAIAGVEVALPPRSALPAMRRPGDPAALGEWLTRAGLDPRTTAVVACVDMLAYGGLIASRTTADPVEAVLQRLRVLEELRSARPDLPLAALSLVTRASDGYSTDEEPEYWGSYGRELHRLGAVLHARFLDEEAAEPAVPDDIRGDFERRRLRNHIVNLATLELHRRGIVDPLLLTADDTAARSAGSLEQAWLRHWMRALPAAAPGVLMYPGADEVGAILVARSLSTLDSAPVHIAIACGEPGGLSRVAPYENQPVGDGARGQVVAAGALPDGGAARPDAVLVIHAPDPDRGDWCGGVAAEPAKDPVASTVETVKDALARGVPVGLADARYANGGDPYLIEALRAAGLLLELAAYGGWNTAGNAIGSVVAALKSTVVGRRLGRFDPAAARRLLLHRLVEDWAYQAVVRTRLVAEHGLGYNVGGLGRWSAAEYATLAERELGLVLGELDADASIHSLTLPWQRTFEIDFELVLG